MPSSLTPSTPIQYLKGVGPYVGQLLEKKSITTAWDMLHYFPFKYINLQTLHTIRTIPAEKRQSFLGKIESYTEKTIRGRGRRMIEILVSDNTGWMRIIFFRFKLDSLQKRFPEGSRVLFFGDVRFYRGGKTMAHPEMELWEEDDASPPPFGGRVSDRTGEGEPAIRIYPFYSLTEGLYQKTIRGIIAKNLDGLLSFVRDEPRSVRESGEVAISLVEAFRLLHHPPLDSDMTLLNEHRSPFHQRVIYDEFFYLQLGLLSKKYKQAIKKTFTVDATQSELFKKSLSILPFELTGDQKDALQEIYSDFAKAHPMNRLLQGDVGCGKTIVAFISGLPIIDAGFQMALMAPTEILAEQHLRTLTPFCEKLGLRVELLKGSTTDKQRKEILQGLADGSVQLLIGTHALITPDVLFNNLGYAVIDEQHRFGVEQRAELKNKSKQGLSETIPHILVMTATPIPRTLSMCLYGDMDLSLIRELPKGRKPIQTKVLRERGRLGMYAFIRDEIRKGRQAYFVYPLIEESEKMDLKDATLMHKRLCETYPEFRVELLHGRMKTADKDQIMAAYKQGDVQILVSTTVIEVGVDVPNATIMVVEHAERFGLSQLHQLRGRVGRGAEKSYCFLVAAYAQSEESHYRLKIMEETTDGFKIAEEDLRIRGPGEFLGTRQSGLPDFSLAELARDGHLLSVAKKRAEEILSTDPSLSHPENNLMRHIMIERWGRKLDLTLV